MRLRATPKGLPRRAPPYRYYLSARGYPFGEKRMEEEVILLGVDLSVCVAQAMFLLCDDTRTLLFFCLKLWKHVLPEWDPVLDRLLLVIHHVYSKDIKPKNASHPNCDGKSAQWKLVRTTWNDFVCGVVVLHRLVLVLTRKYYSADDWLLWSAISKYKQELDNLDDKLRSAKDVSEANGFARKRIESSTYHFWKSLFDEEAGQETPRVIKERIISDLFGPISGQTMDVEITALTLYSPYILGSDFAKQEQKNELVRLGVELSLYVAQSMFLLCDDIRSLLRHCCRLARDARNHRNTSGPVVERLLRVIHYVYFKSIQPKNGVYHNDGISAQWRLAMMTWQHFRSGFTNLHVLVSVLRGEEGFTTRGRSCMSTIESQLQMIHHKLPVSKANGFRREAIEPSILGLWNSLFDREAKEATQTLQVIQNNILYDLFLPLHNGLAPP